MHIYHMYLAQKKILKREKEQIEDKNNKTK